MNKLPVFRGQDLRFITLPIGRRADCPPKTCPSFDQQQPRQRLFVPHLSLVIPARSTALMCTKTSLPPSSIRLVPKPFWLLNHFTVPCVIISSSFRYVW